MNHIDILSQTKTTEMNTALVLAPDGTGKVGFRAETGGGGGGTSGELLMQDGVTHPPVPLETEDGTDWLYQG